jgi:hypothetical protein
VSNVGQVNKKKYILILIQSLILTILQLSENQIKSKRKRRSLCEVRVPYFCYLLCNYLAHWVVGKAIVDKSMSFRVNRQGQQRPGGMASRSNSSPRVVVVVICISETVWINIVP